jgi:hypothetical protein
LTLVVCAGSANASDFKNVGRVDVQLQSSCPSKEISLVLNDDDTKQLLTTRQTIEEATVWSSRLEKPPRLDLDTLHVSVRFPGGRTRCYGKPTDVPDPKDHSKYIVTFVIASCALDPMHDYTFNANTPIFVTYTRALEKDSAYADTVECSETAKYSTTETRVLRSYWRGTEDVAFQFFDKATPKVPFDALLETPTPEKTIGRQKLLTIWSVQRGNQSNHRIAVENANQADAKYVDPKFRWVKFMEK